MERNNYGISAESVWITSVSTRDVYLQHGQFRKPTYLFCFLNHRLLIRFLCPHFVMFVVCVFFSLICFSLFFISSCFSVVFFLYFVLPFFLSLRRRLPILRNLILTQFSSSLSLFFFSFSFFIVIIFFNDGIFRSRLRDKYSFRRKPKTQFFCP